MYNQLILQKVSELQGHSNENRGNAERLSEAYQERQREALELKTQLEESEEKRRSIQATLDSAYK